MFIIFNKISKNDVNRTLIMILVRNYRVKFYAISERYQIQMMPNPTALKNLRTKVSIIYVLMLGKLNDLKCERLKRSGLLLELIYIQ